MLQKNVHFNALLAIERRLVGHFGGQKALSLSIIRQFSWSLIEYVRRGGILLGFFITSKEIWDSRKDSMDG